MKVVDFDGDGDLDLVSGSYNDDTIDNDGVYVVQSEVAFSTGDGVTYLVALSITIRKIKLKFNLSKFLLRKEN